jgi:hypothetical protein
VNPDESMSLAKLYIGPAAAWLPFGNLPVIVRLDAAMTGARRAGLATLVAIDVASLEASTLEAIATDGGERV